MRSPSSRTFAWISSEATSTGPIPSIIQESPPLGSRRAAARPGTSLEETGACCRLAPAVGAVGPRRDQERHVVVGGGVGDAEPDRHAPEKGRVRDSLAREVLADLERDLVHARLRLVEQRRVGAAVGVGGRLLQELPAVARRVEAEELEAEACGRTACGGVQDGGCQGHHGLLSTQPSIWPYGSRVAWKISPSLSIPNRARS